MAIQRPDTSRSQLYRRPDPSEVSCSDKRMSASPHAGDRILAQVGLGSPRRKNPVIRRQCWNTFAGFLL
jgi:hypothetical protein